MDAADEAAGIDVVLGVEGVGVGREARAAWLGEATEGEGEGRPDAAVDERPAELAEGGGKGIHWRDKGTSSWIRRTRGGVAADRGGGSRVDEYGLRICLKTEAGERATKEQGKGKSEIRGGFSTPPRGRAPRLWSK